MTSQPIELRTPVDLGLVAQESAGCGCGCSCGGQDEANAVLLDTRQIPHAIRHATIFGALDSIASGASLDIVADHNPLPMLAQLEDSRPGDFAVDYLVSGPDAWMLRFTRA
jgi:uncharacterized protein (DUF2249 family)